MRMRTTKETWVKFMPSRTEMDETLNLSACLEISRVEAAAYIALLVAFGIKYCSDDGDGIGTFADKTIEDACVWEGVRGQLVQAFIASGILMGDRESDDDSLRISPVVWQALAGDAIEKRHGNAERQQTFRDNKKKGINNT